MSHRIWVAARYDRPIVLGPESQIMPAVVGPGRVPVVTDSRLASMLPELAVLSAMMHYRHPQRTEVLAATAAAFAQFEAQRRALY